MLQNSHVPQLHDPGYAVARLNHPFAPIYVRNRQYFTAHENFAGCSFGSIFLSSNDRGDDVLGLDMPLVLNSLVDPNIDVVVAISLIWRLTIWSYSWC